MPTNDDRQKYAIEVLQRQVIELEKALNEARQKLGLSEIQIPKPARPHNNF